MVLLRTYMCLLANGRNISRINGVYCIQLNCSLVLGIIPDEIIQLGLMNKFLSMINSCTHSKHFPVHFQKWKHLLDDANIRSSEVYEDFCERSYFKSHPLFSVHRFALQIQFTTTCLYVQIILGQNKVYIKLDAFTSFSKTFLQSWILPWWTSILYRCFMHKMVGNMVLMKFWNLQ